MQKLNRTPEEIEADWYNNVYQGDNMAQLTVRAILIGSVLGGLMSLSNLYVGLKTGWALGVAITACVMSFAINRLLLALFPRYYKTEMSILENNCMQSTASAAGYSTGGTMVSGVAAYLIISGHHIGWVVLTLWTFFLASLGVFLAVPLKKQMINVEQLRFPSGTAAAETLRSLHAKGGEALLKAKSLGISGVLGAIVAWFREAGKPFAIPGSLHFPGGLAGHEWAKWTVSVEMSPLMVAAGAIVGWRVAWSMLLGAILNYMVFAPRMVELGAIDVSKLGYRAIVAWSTWGGAAIMVTSGLLIFFMNGKTVLRAFSGLLPRSRAKTGLDAKIEAIEVPSWWFITGFILSGLGCVLILHYAFDTTFWMGTVAVVLTFFLSVVACRSTGESDITPVGALGKITQLMFGGLAPSNITTNLMTASVTAGAAGSAADLMVDLKSGYLLGANPRKQFIAQYLGIFAGTAVVVPAFYILVPNSQALGTDQWPAPSAQVWAAVAQLLAAGIDALHPAAQNGLIVGGIAGLIFPLLEKFFPKARPFIPSAIGLGIAFVIPFFNSLSFFIGATIALILEKKRPKLADMYVVPVSSGIIAGESLMGIVVALLSASGMI